MSTHSSLDVYYTENGKNVCHFSVRSLC
uniref:Uncharacterized protein n=1 Tax=Anguilla anguilla TaxID=7936 RepID=A0A0E9U6G1_ANGAN